MDAALHRLRYRSGLSAALFRTNLFGTSRYDEYLRMTAPPRVYLLDVEGTVAPISLVSEQLFPYARARFGDFLKKQIDEAGVRADLLLLAEENQAETTPGVPRMPVARTVSDADG